MKPIFADDAAIEYAANLLRRPPGCISNETVYGLVLMPPI